MRMATNDPVEQFELLLAALMAALTDAAREYGLPQPLVLRKIVTHQLLLAAELHDGSDASFLIMARQALALTRTGVPSQ